MSLTFEEIHKQPRDWAITSSLLMAQRSRWEEQFRLGRYDSIYFIGCGTSYYLAETAAHLFQEKTGMDCRAIPSSEIMLSAKLVVAKPRKNLLIAVSRSGSTTETVKAIEAFSQEGLGDTLSISCRGNSPAAQAASMAIELEHCFDHSVVMTGTFTNMLLATQLLAAFAAGDEAYLNELKKLSDVGQTLLAKTKDWVEQLGSDLDIKQFIYLGFGSYFGLAAEAMMKLKEMTQVATESYNPLEFRHGPISVIEKDSAAVLLLNDKSSDLQVEILQDVKHLGGQTVLLSEAAVQADFVDKQCTLQSGMQDSARAVLYMPIVQSIGYYRAVALGLDPDRPRFLNQVTMIQI